MRYTMHGVSTGAGLGGDDDLAVAAIDNAINDLRKAIVAELELLD